MDLRTLDETSLVMTYFAFFTLGIVLTLGLGANTADTNELIAALAIIIPVTELWHTRVFYTFQSL